MLPSKCERMFKNGTSKICGRQPLKNEMMRWTYKFKFFKVCLPQFILVPFLNSLSQIITIDIKARHLSNRYPHKELLY